MDALFVGFIVAFGFGKLFMHCWKEKDVEMPKGVQIMLEVDFELEFNEFILMKR